MLVSGIAYALLGLVALTLGYLYVLALAGYREPPAETATAPQRRFAIAIPAHNEEATIGATVRQLRRQTYPAGLFTIFVVADHCTDRTPAVARAAGAVCLEHDGADGRGKGRALAWLFGSILAQPEYDAVVVFDADSFVDANFLRVMNGMMGAGHRAVQGKHVIANPAAGWFPAVMYAAYAIDNRLRNQGRSNLGLSSKLMGDAMCFTGELLQAHPWQTTSDTEDAEYWAMLASNGVRVAFAPQAISYGEMVTDLEAARRQRSRWMRGRAEATRRFALPLLWSGLRRRRWLQLDVALDLAMPAYSTLVVLSLLVACAFLFAPPPSGAPWPALHVVLVALLVYPLMGLVLERAPARVHLALLWGAPYVLWRSALRLWTRLRPATGIWVRTPRSSERGPRDR